MKKYIYNSWILCWRGDYTYSNHWGWGLMGFHESNCFTTGSRSEMNEYYRSNNWKEGI